jgi:hypothetical protein
VLLTAGYRDPRVRYWEPAKYASRLRHALSKGGSSDSGDISSGSDNSGSDNGISDAYNAARSGGSGGNSSNGKRRKSVVLLETNMGAGHTGDAQDDARDLAFLIHEVGERL